MPDSVKLCLNMSNTENFKFLNHDLTRQIARQYGTPVFVYDQKSLKSRAMEVLSFNAPFGLTARYAMKACPNVNVLRYFHSLGIKIDASSEYEVERAILAGIPAQNILLTAQQRTDKIKDFYNKGVKFDACNLNQLKTFGEVLSGQELGVRINPGAGSGGSNRTNTGGPASSFGIWHEYIPEILELAKKYSLKIKRVHTHIGSGSDPDVWSKVSAMSIDLLDSFPEAEILNLGGGYKVGRMSYEPTADLSQISCRASELLTEFAQKSGRKIHLEIEPGTYFMANSAALISNIDSISDTGSQGYKYYVLNTGLTEVARPALYGAQHPLIVVSNEDANERTETEEVIVAGHCCESGDILTPQPGDPEGLKPRLMNKANIGDYLVVDSTGAYCSGMSLKNYNSFPEAAEVWISEDGSVELIRRQQRLDQITQNEIRII